MLRQIGQGQIIPHGDSRPELLSAQGHAEAFERETVQKCTGPILGLDCFSFSRHLLTRHARKTGPLGCARDLPKILGVNVGTSTIGFYRRTQKSVGKTSDLASSRPGDSSGISHPSEVQQQANLQQTQMLTRVPSHDMPGTH